MSRKLLNSSQDIFFKLYPNNKDYILFGSLNRAFTPEECSEIVQYISTTELKTQLAAYDSNIAAYIKDWIVAINHELLERELMNKKRLRIYK